MTGTEGAGHRVYRHNRKGHTVIQTRMVYDIAIDYYISLLIRRQSFLGCK